MNKFYRKTLIATAIAALMSAPAWSDTHDTDMETDGDATTDSQIQDSETHDSQSDDDTWNDDLGTEEDGDWDDEEFGSDDGIDGMGDHGDNALMSMTPDELNGMEVIGSDGESIGDISEVVGSLTDDEAYAVVSHGGVLGIGAHEFVIPLSELMSVNEDQVRAEFNESEAEMRPDYDSDSYAELESDRPVSEYSSMNQ